MGLWDGVSAWRDADVSQGEGPAEAAGRHAKQVLQLRGDDVHGGPCGVAPHQRL